ARAPRHWMDNRGASTTIRGGRRRLLGTGLIACLAALLSAVAPTVARAEDDSPSRMSVLLLYADSRMGPTVLRVDEAIRSRFQTTGVQAEFVTEYLDLWWPSGPRYTEQLRTFFLAKHRGKKFDVVIPVGSEALRFAMDNRSELFPDVPIVFCLAPPAGLRGIRLAPDVTGISMVIDAAATLETAHRLQPRARGVVIVAGASTTDKILLDDVKRDLAASPGGLVVSYLVGLPLDEAREHLARLPRETIVLFVSMMRDGAGRAFSG